MTRLLAWLLGHKCDECGLRMPPSATTYHEYVEHFRDLSEAS